MPLQHYVSAEWVIDETMGTRTIKATGDDGQVYWVPGDNPLTYDVSPWPDFVKTEAGRQFLAASPPPAGG